MPAHDPGNFKAKRTRDDNINGPIGKLLIMDDNNDFVGTLTLAWDRLAINLDRCMLL